MITLPQYLVGRDKAYPLTEELLTNARETVAKANDLLLLFGEDRAVTSGYRPPAVNAKTPGAAKRSKHMTCQAIDLEDADGDLDEWCMNNQQRLVELGLWQEHPAATKGWCHLQIVPPKSGNRVYYP